MSRWSWFRVPFLPAIAVMNRLTFARKFMLIGALTSGPLAALAYLQYSSATERIEFNERERIGLTYLAPLSRFLHQVQLHRVYSAAVTVREVSFVVPRDRAQELASRAAAEVDALDDRYGSVLKTAPAWRAARDAWNELVESPAQDASAVEEAHGRLSRQLVDLTLHQVGNYSNLILDPDLDSYWLMDALVVKLPDLEETVSRATATLLSARRGSMSAPVVPLAADYRLELMTLDELLALNMATVFREASFRDASLEATLSPPLAQAQHSVQDHADLLRRFLAGPGEDLAPGLAPVVDVATRALDDMSRLQDAVGPRLDELIAGRVHSFALKRTQGLVAALGVTLVLAYLLIAIYLSVRRSVLAIQTGAAPSRLDDFAPASQDELGDLATAYKEARGEKNRLEEQLRLADRLATIGTLAAGTAHELNEPLGAILGFAQLAAKAPGLPEGARRDLDKIAQATLHARDVIKKLMLFARQAPPDKTTIDLRQVVAEALDFLEQRFERAGISLSRSFGAVPAIVADASQLRQVVLNLVVNALQASRCGGEVRVSLEQAGALLYLAVEDDGSGMTDEIREKIFLPFYTTKEVGQGTGLGLSVVHGIVTAHGGAIRVDTAPGTGTRFEVTLPIVTA